MLTEWIVKNPLKVFVVFTILTFLIASQAFSIEIVSNMDDYLPNDDSTVMVLNDIGKDWPVEMIIVYAETDESDGATRAENLKEIYDVEKKLNGELGSKGIEYTVSLASLIAETNKRITQEDSVPSRQQIVDLYMSQFPDSMKYKLISRDGRDAIMLLALSKDADQAEVLRGVNEIISESHINMRTTGPVAMSQDAVEWAIANMMPITIFSLVSVCAVLFLFHRNLKIVLITGAPVVYALAITAGMLGFMDVHLTPNVVAAGGVIVAMGIAYGLYMANRFAEEVQKLTPEEAVKRTLTTTGRAIFLSAITTMVGFASLMAAPMPPVSSLGLALTIGTFFCYLSAVILVPCLLLILRYRKKGKIVEWMRLASLTQHPKKIALVITSITLFSLACIPSISYQVDLISMAPEGIPSVDMMKVYSEKFGAGQPSFFAVSGDILDPDVLKSMDELQQKINGVTDVSCYSIVDVIKKLNGGSIPQTRQQSEFIVNNILGPKQRRMMLNENMSRAIVFVDMPMAPLEKTEVMVEGVSEAMEGGIDNCQVTPITGIGPIIVSIHYRMMQSQISSAAVAFIAVFLCMIPVFRSLRYSLLTMVPLTITLLWEPMTLVGLGVPLTVITITISSMVIGVGVDFGVQITQRVIDERKAGAGGLEAVFEATTKIGPSLFEATATIVAGLLPLFLLEYPVMRHFIAVDVLMISYACLTAVVILPSLYSLRYGRWIESWTPLDIGISIPDFSKMASDISEHVSAASAGVSKHISGLNIRSLSEWIASRRNRR